MFEHKNKHQLRIKVSLQNRSLDSHSRYRHLKTAGKVTVDSQGPTSRFVWIQCIGDLSHTKSWGHIQYIFLFRERRLTARTKYRVISVITRQRTIIKKKFILQLHLILIGEQLCNWLFSNRTIGWRTVRSFIYWNIICREFGLFWPKKADFCSWWEALGSARQPIVRFENNRLQSCSSIKIKCSYNINFSFVIVRWRVIMLITWYFVSAVNRRSRNKILCYMCPQLFVSSNIAIHCFWFHCLVGSQGLTVNFLFTDKITVNSESPTSCLVWKQCIVDLFHTKRWGHA